MGADTQELEKALDRVADKGSRAAQSVQNVRTPGNARDDMAWAVLPPMNDASPMGPNGELLQNVNNSYGLMDKELRNIIDSFRRFREILDKAELMPKPYSGGHEPVDPNPENLPGTEKAGEEDKKQGKNFNVAGGVIGASQGFSDAARSVAGGDPWSAGLGGLNRIGQGAMKAGTAADGTMSVLGMLGVAGVAAALIGGGANAIANQYENALPGIDALLTAFGGEGVNGANARINAGSGLALRGTAATMSKGTGLDTDTFISYMSRLSGHGVTDVTRAGALTNAAAGWSRYSGADMNQVLDFMGFAERHGTDGRDATMSAYNAARASGLEKGQFSEFLSGVQRVMEDGISKGFIKSSKEVADSLANLSLLGGGNKVFQGEAGARMYMNMASGLAGNTALGSTSNILTYRTMAGMMGEDDKNAKKLLGAGNYLEGGSVFNELALMEKGDVGNLEFLQGLKKQLEGAYGKDRDSIVASYKEIFGLNNQGAIQVYNALTDANMSDVERQAKLKTIQEDPTMKSDATRLQDTLTELNRAIVEMGKPVFDIKLAGLEKVESGVDKIYNFLVGDSYKSLVNSAVDPLFDALEKREAQHTKDNLHKLLMSSNQEERAKGISLIDELSGLNKEQIHTINDLNLFDSSLVLPSMIPSDYSNKYESMKNYRPEGAGFSVGEIIEGYKYHGTEDGKELSLLLRQAIASGATEKDFDDILKTFNTNKFFGRHNFDGAIELVINKINELVEVTKSNGEKIANAEVIIER